MDLDAVLSLSRLTLAGLGLVLMGRLLRSARIYLTWRALGFYALAWLAFLFIALLRLRLFGLPDLLLLRAVLEAFFLAAVAGSLYEHVRADRRRRADARRLMEQWRLASGLARHRAHELEVLAGITASLVASLDTRRVLQAVVDHAVRLAGADSASVYVVEGETGQLRGHGFSLAGGSQRLTELPPPRAHGLTVSVARAGQPAFVEDAAQHPLFQGGVRPNLGAVASVPLKVSGAVVGVLNVGYRRARPFDQDDRRLLCALADISALAIHNAAQHERLGRLAVTDELTGLPNRRRFLEVLRFEAQRARRYQRPLSLLMLDLDGLKAINDRHGHAAGDAVLRGLAQVLRANTRDTDLPARLSGDEFAVLLPETDLAAAEHIAGRIRAGLADVPVTVDGSQIHATVSLGLVSAVGQALPELSHFMRLGDAALYQAKAAGRNVLFVGAPEPPALPPAAVDAVPPLPSP